MKNFISSDYFGWFCFGLVFFVAHSLLFLLIKYAKAKNTPEDVEKSGINKIKSPKIHMILYATVCITTIIDYLFETNTFTINILIWFIIGVVYVIRKIISLFKRNKTNN